MAGKKRKEDEDISDEEKGSLSEPTSIKIGKPAQAEQAAKPEVKSEEKAASAATSAQPANPATQQPTASKGMDDNTLAFVAYILCWLTGLIVFLIAKDNAKDVKFVKFHAMQAILLGVATFVLSITIIGIFLAPLIWLYGLYIGFVYAYKGQKYYAPVIGEYAERFSQEN